MTPSSAKLTNCLGARHGDGYKKVLDYYLAHRDRAAIEDVSTWLPELVAEMPELEDGSGTA